MIEIRDLLSKFNHILLSEEAKIDSIKKIISEILKTEIEFKDIKIDYMKIDVEGTERLVFLGAKRTIEKYRPIIIYEKKIYNLFGCTC